MILPHTAAEGAKSDATAEKFTSAEQHGSIEEVSAGSDGAFQGAATSKAFPSYRQAKVRYKRRYRAHRAR